MINSGAKGVGRKGLRMSSGVRWLDWTFYPASLVVIVLGLGHAFGFFAGRMAGPESAVSFIALLFVFAFGIGDAIRRIYERDGAYGVLSTFVVLEFIFGIVPFVLLFVVDWLIAFAVLLLWLVSYLFLALTPQFRRIYWEHKVAIGSEE